MTSKNKGHAFFIMSSFVHHFKSIGEFKLELQSGNAQSGSKSDFFLPRVTLKFYGWPWKTIGHLLYITSIVVHHFKAIGEFELALQSGNALFGSKSAFFAVWPWNVTVGLEKHDISTFVHYFVAIDDSNWSYSPDKSELGQDKRFLAVWPWNLTDDPAEIGHLF